MICVAFRAWLLSRFAHIAARIGTSLLLSHNQTPRVLRLETRIRPGRGVKVTAGPRRRAFRLLELTVPPPGPVTRLPHLLFGPSWSPALRGLRGRGQLVAMVPDCLGLLSDPWGLPRVCREGEGDPDLGEG